MVQEDTSRHWAEVAADEILSKKSNEPIYTFLSGISPSGVVHFGNFRDLMTSYAVMEAVKRRDKKVRLLFFWDDFDRFRKVPAGVSADFEQHIGKSLSQVPDPLNEYPSYAKRFEVEFEKAMETLGLDIQYFYQSEEYGKGSYDDLIITAMQKRQEIAKILFDSMSDKAKSEKNINEKNYVENYYPINIYSRFSGRDNTEIIDYDGNETLTYKCKDTDKTETINLRHDHIVKFSWKIDWPMRWKKYGATFEPGGKDHATPGSSFDVSSQIARKIFGIEPPEFVGYQFVGIRGLGAKMSGSKGNAVSPAQLLEIYEPYLLKWLYLRRSPEQSFSLAFDSEIYRQYDEIDCEIAAYKDDTLSATQKTALEIALTKNTETLPGKTISFRQIVGFGQVVQWDFAKMVEMMTGLNLEFDHEVLRSRLEKARAWLTQYNPDQFIKLLDEPNNEFAAKLDHESKKMVEKLVASLSADLSVAELESLVYSIPKQEGVDQKENAKLQRDFFKIVYQLLIGAETGPRLSTFLWAADRDKVIKLLEI